MAVKYEITDHALRRFNERFGYIESSIESLLENSMIFGGQKGAEYLLLNPQHEIVFPIACYKEDKHHVVKTVLTLDQAKANLSMSHRLEFNSDISDRIEQIRKKAKEEQIKSAQTPKPVVQQKPMELTQEIKTKIKDYAQKHIEKRGWYFPDKQERKDMFAQMKLDLGISRKIFDDYFLPEIGRLIREKKK